MQLQVRLANTSWDERRLTGVVTAVGLSLKRPSASA